MIDIETPLVGLRMWLKTNCEIAFEVPHSMPFVFMLRPRSGASQWVNQETYQVEPMVQVTEAMDAYGNLCQRLVAPAGNFLLKTSSVVKVPAFCDEDPSAMFVEIPYLPDETLGFLLPSRFCEADRLNSLAMEIVAGLPPGYQQIQAIVSWIKQNVRYTPAEGDATPISAIEAIHRGHGVCRDLAHVGVSLCRSLCIPARFVVGYLHELEPMDIHAWFEAYVGGRWYTFDATQDNLLGGRITIAYGRDATDVAICNQYGPAVDPHHMLVQVSELETGGLVN